MPSPETPSFRLVSFPASPPSILIDRLVQVLVRTHLSSVVSWSESPVARVPRLGVRTRLCEGLGVGKVAVSFNNFRETKA